MIRGDVMRSVCAAYVLRELATRDRLIAPKRWAAFYRHNALHGPRVQLPPLRSTV